MPGTFFRIEADLVIEGKRYEVDLIDWIEPAMIAVTENFHWEPAVTSRLFADRSTEGLFFWYEYLVDKAAKKKK